MKRRRIKKVKVQVSFIVNEPSIRWRCWLDRVDRGRTGYNLRLTGYLYISVEFTTLRHDGTYA